MRTFTVTHIQRPFTRTSDAYNKSSLPQYFYHRIPFYTLAEDGGYIFHVKGKIQLFSSQEVAEFVERGVVIQLPYPVSIDEKQGLYLGLTSTVYAADRVDPKWEEKTCFCALESLRTHEETSYIKGDTLNFYDVIVVTHLIRPYEGYPTEPGVLRAMTVVTQNCTMEVSESRRFGPKRMFVRDIDEKWKQWEDQGRIIPLAKPILFNPGPYNVHDKDLGEGFWTDHNKVHHYGSVPKEAKCSFYTHLLLGGNKPQDGEIRRSQGYYGVYYLLDVDLTVYSGYPPTENQFHESQDVMKEREQKGEVIKLPYPLRIPSNHMLWISSEGNIYLAHGQKPNEHPYEFIMNSPLVAALPAPGESLIRYHDFAIEAQ